MVAKTKETKSGKPQLTVKGVLDAIESIRKSLQPVIDEKTPKDDRLCEADNELIALSDRIMDDGIEG